MPRTITSCIASAALVLVLPSLALAAPADPTATRPPPPRLVTQHPCTLRYVADDRVAKAEHLRSAGFTTMIVGTSVAALATMIIPIGFVSARRNLDDHEACVDSGGDDCSSFDTRAQHGTRAMYSGIILLGLGLHTLIAGGITYGVANARLRRAERSGVRSFALAPLRSGVGFGLTGRF